MTDVLQNEIASPVKLTLGNKEYELTLPFSAVIRYKQASGGDNLFNPKHWARVDEDPEKLVKLLWAAAQEKQPDTKSEELEKELNITNVLAVKESLTKLLLSYVPKPKPSAAGEDPNAQSQK